MSSSKSTKTKLIFAEGDDDVDNEILQLIRIAPAEDSNRRLAAAIDKALKRTSHTNGLPLDGRAQTRPRAKKAKTS